MARAWLRLCTGKTLSFFQRHLGLGCASSVCRKKNNAWRFPCMQTRLYVLMYANSESRNPQHSYHDLIACSRQPKRRKKKPTLSFSLSAVFGLPNHRVPSFISNHFVLHNFNSIPSLLSEYPHPRCPLCNSSTCSSKSRSGS